MYSNAVVTLTNGVVFGYWRNVGLWMENNSGLVSQGTPNQRNVIVYYSLVQEQPVKLMSSDTNLSDYPVNSYPITTYHSTLTKYPSVYLRFTSIYAPQVSQHIIYTPGNYGVSNLNALDCETYGASAQWNLNVPAGGRFALQNNLFQYTQIPASVTGTLIGYNNLMRGDGNDYYAVTGFGGSTITNHNNAFDGLTGGITMPGTIGYNAYLNTNTIHNSILTNDIVTNLTWISGPLGNYYQPTNSPLIDRGNTTADQLGLYHYTTQTNELPETNSIVDIGYHYVAVDVNGNPIDLNSNGIPDYLETPDGPVPPYVAVQPLSQDCVPGSGVEFTAGVDGIMPISYQWLFNGTNITGQTNSQLILYNLQTTNGGNYSLVATNIGGSVTSTPAVLTICVPGFNSLTNISVAAGSGAHTISLSGITGGCSTNTVLSFSATSSDTNLVGTPTINYTNWNSMGSLILTPGLTATGSVTISVILNNQNAGGINGVISFGSGGYVDNANPSLASYLQLGAGVTLGADSDNFGSITNGTPVLFTSIALSPGSTSSPFWIFTNAGTVYSMEAELPNGAAAGYLTLTMAGPGIFHETGFKDSFGSWNGGANFSVGSTNVFFSMSAGVTSTYAITNTFQVTVLPSTNAPVVQLTSPTNNQVFVFSPTNVLLTATATSSIGISNVEFFVGSTALGSTNLTPYQFLWTNVSAGVYAISAKVTDNIGAAATNTVTNIIVNATPMVSIISPTNLSYYLEVTNVTLSASASDSDGSISSVQFYSFTNLLGTVTSTGTNGYYNLFWTNLSAGVYPIVAVATDNRGAASFSSNKVFRVASANSPPSITISYPTNGSTFPACADYTILTSVTQGTGAITNVEFFVNGVSVGSITNIPFNLTRSDCQPGTNVLQAMVTDALGFTATSASITNIITSQDPVGNGFWDPNFGNPGVYDDDTDGFIYAMAINGTDLYVAGDFQGMNVTSTPSVPYAIAKWDGTNWTPMPDTNYGADRPWFCCNANFDEPVCAIALQGKNVYIGGATNLAGESYLERWNGVTWDQVGSPLQGSIYAIAIGNSNIYVGGDFQSVGGDASMQYMAMMTSSNTNWASVGAANVNGPVLAIVNLDDTLFIGGNFTAAGTNSNLNFIAQLNANSWVDLAGGVSRSADSNPGIVRALAVYGHTLVVGGDFDTVSGNNGAAGIAQWNQNKWNTIGGGLSPSSGGLDIAYYDYGRAIFGPSVRALAVRCNELFVGGRFIGAFNGTNLVIAHDVTKATWHEDLQSWTWEDLDEGFDVVDSSYYDSTGPVVALALMPGATNTSYDLFVSGDFSTAGPKQQTCNDIARWSVGRPYPPTAPTVTMTQPQSGTVFTFLSTGYTTNITLSANVSTYNSNIASVNFVLDRRYSDYNYILGPATNTSSNIY